MTLAFWLILFTTSSMANMLGLNISSGLNSVITIYILIPFILVPQLLLGGVIVKYDSLNKTFRHREYVPVIGDLMTSRWAYEALAVHQFKNNKFEKNFFEFDKNISNSTYVRNFLIQQLEGKADETEMFIRRSQNEEKISSNLNLIKSEILAAQRSYDWPAFKEIDNISVAKFDTTVVNEVKFYLEGIKKRAIKTKFVLKVTGLKSKKFNFTTFNT